MAGADAMGERIAATLGYAAVLKSDERTAATRSTAGAPVVRLRSCGRPAREIPYRFCGADRRPGPRRGDFGPFILPLHEALDLVATEGFFWINAWRLQRHETYKLKLRNAG